MARIDKYRTVVVKVNISVLGWSWVMGALF